MAIGGSSTAALQRCQEVPQRGCEKIEGKEANTETSSLWSLQCLKGILSGIKRGRSSERALCPCNLPLLVEQTLTQEFL